MLVNFAANIICMLRLPGDNCGIVKHTDEMNRCVFFFWGGGREFGGGKAVATSTALSMVPYN